MCFSKMAGGSTGSSTFSAFGAFGAAALGSGGGGGAAMAETAEKCPRKNSKSEARAARQKTSQKEADSSLNPALRPPWSTPASSRRASTASSLFSSYVAAFRLGSCAWNGFPDAKSYLAPQSVHVAMFFFCNTWTGLMVNLGATSFIFIGMLAALRQRSCVLALWGTLAGLYVLFLTFVALAGLPHFVHFIISAVRQSGSPTAVIASIFLASLFLVVYYAVAVRTLFSFAAI